MSHHLNEAARDEMTLAIEWTTANKVVWYIPVADLHELSLIRALAPYVEGATAKVVPRNVQREQREFPQRGNGAWTWFKYSNEFETFLKERTGGVTLLDHKITDLFWAGVDDHTSVNHLARIWGLQ